MKYSDREIIESPLYQGISEEIVYTLDTTPWGGSPGNVAVTLWDEANTDVSATHLTGSAAVNVNAIVTPAVHSLETGKKYRLEIAWEYAGSKLEAFAVINGQR